MPNKNYKPRKKNKKPEQQTVKECMEWFHEFGFSMHVVDSTAVYSVSAGRYLTGQTVAGFSDSAGCTPEGVGCFVEFKAKGQLRTLRPAQREFLRAKILKGCFACVVDSKTLLHETYFHWVRLERIDSQAPTAYLLDQLPRMKLREDNIFPDEIDL